MSISPFDHPILSGLFGAEGISDAYSAENDVALMLRFETALAEAEAAEGLIPESAAKAIGAFCEQFTPDIPALNASTARDGVIVPGLVAQLRAGLGAEHAPYLHYGATSQDVTDTALIMRIAVGLGSLENGLTRIVGRLLDLQTEFGDNQIMGVTRMQDALPITVGHRIDSWRGPLVRNLERTEEFKPRLLVVQFGGAVGTLDKLGDKGTPVRRRLADLLGLGVADDVWHSQRDCVVEYASWLALVTGALGKIGQDLMLMAQQNVAAVSFSGGGGSSAMPHKQNPVIAEVLVALARFNAVQASAMQQAMIHEYERSGAAWTLEWLTLRQMIAAASGAVARAEEMLGQIERLG
jgi:3-carboxy-cis,cis-muconate cycloisomerase